MTLSRRIIAGLLVCSIAAAATGCTSMKTLKPVTEPGAPPFGKLKAGDAVRVQTRDGATVRFVVQGIEANAIVGPNGSRYTRGDIVRLQRRSFSPWKTGVLIGATAFAALVAFGLAVVTSDDFGKWE